MIPELENVDIDYLVNNREAFNKFVYTPLNDALNELDDRSSDLILKEKVSEILENDLPEVFCSGKKKAFIMRHLATPNYEIRRFVQIIDAIEQLDPVFGEYLDDKFYTINEQKKYLGKILYFKNHKDFSDHTKIVDFEKCEGLPISEIHTLGGKKLVDFHHSLFEKTFIPIKKESFFDASKWLNKHGKNAVNYYRPVLSWFIQNAILFENFLLTDKNEISFIRNIFLPTFVDLWKDTGKKPLIVNLLPTSSEDKKFWFCHPQDIKDHIESNF